MEESRFVAEILAETSLKVTHKVIDQYLIVDYYSSYLSTLPTKIELIDRDIIDKVLDGFTMSVTSLNKYLTCPLTFYFENILRVPGARSIHMGFGSAVHYALELFFREIRQDFIPEVDRLIHHFHKGMDKYRSHFTDKEYKDRIAFGEQTLQGFYDENKTRWTYPQRYELEYGIKNASHRGVPISGKLDKVEIYKDHVVVVDYKTGKPSNARPKLRRPSETEIGGDYWRQIIFYKMLIDADTRITLENGFWRNGFCSAK